MIKSAGHLPEIPDAPEGLWREAMAGRLVVFIGAGISRLVGCPSWEEFANEVLNQLASKGIINYQKKSLLEKINDPRWKLSVAEMLAEKEGDGYNIDYKEILHVERPKSNVYDYVNRFKCGFVTTNYDKFIAPERSKRNPEEKWRIYQKRDFLGGTLDRGGTVVHLHGHVGCRRSMIISINDYDKHYVSDEVDHLLKHLFARRTVLFLGYGLSEREIMEKILQWRKKRRANNGLFILQGFYGHESYLYNSLRLFYQEQFQANLIGFSMDAKEYRQQEDIIEKWSETLIFGDLMSTGQEDAMMEELND